MHQLSTPDAFLSALLRTDPGRPLLTFYDDATGERAELSAASTANWVTKTHFLLRDELALGPGDRALVDLPPHYLTLVVLLGVWTAGLEVVREGRAPVAFVGPDAPAVEADEVFALALQPWGRGFTADPPAGAADFVAAVRPHADVWAQVRTAGGGHAVAAAAAARATALGLDAGSRVLLSYVDDAMPDPVELLTPLAVGASSVLVRHAAYAPSDDPRRARERITHLGRWNRCVIRYPLSDAPGTDHSTRTGSLNA